jgi:NAD(P)-dependent dehydrogenase (short-subunit alcohol dehydrogenase family)
MEDDISKRLQDRVAVVTGSTSGIGRATAELFATEGAHVVVSGRRAELGEQVAAGIRGAGGSAAFLRTDVTRRDDLWALVRFAVERFGGLDILMNNAYSGRNGSVLELAEEDWDANMTVMLKAIFLGCKFGIPEMIARGGGSIINVSSVHGVLASPHNIAYNTAKAGMINLTRQLAIDFGPQGIRANVICPGWILTEGNERWLAAHPEARREAQITYPLGRPGRLDEVARAALFLACEESSFITGQALMVDGGLTIQVQDAMAQVFEVRLNPPRPQRADEA